MTDEAWIRGTALLKSCCADRALDKAMTAMRWDEYRNQLDHLTDEQFRHATTIGAGFEFIPCINDLRRWGHELPAPAAGRSLEDEEARRDAAEQRLLAAMTPEQRRARHAKLAAELVERVAHEYGLMLKAELAAQAQELAAAGVPSQPREAR